MNARTRRATDRMTNFHERRLSTLEGRVQHLEQSMERIERRQEDIDAKVDQNTDLTRETRDLTIELRTLFTEMQTDTSTAVNLIKGTRAWARIWKWVIGAAAGCAGIYAALHEAGKL